MLGRGLNEDDGAGLEDDLSLDLFRCLLVVDRTQQQQAMRNVADVLRSSPQLLHVHLPTVVRFATECPFASVRDFFTAFLNEITPVLAKQGVPIPKPKAVSRFFVPNAPPAIDSSDPTLIQIFEDLFLQTGRVSHLSRVLAWHPIYYKNFKTQYNEIMLEPGPLPHDTRHYLAMMAAACYKCSYLVQEQEQEFLASDGDPSWLEGYDSLPPRLKKLAHVNALLAHQPWKVEKAHIEQLVKGDDSWSVPELIQAFIIMATFRSLAVIVHGIGITQEVDFMFKDPEEDKPQPNFVDIESGDTTADVLDKLRNGELKEAPQEPLAQRVKLFTATENKSGDDNETGYAADTGNFWPLELERMFLNPFSDISYADFDWKVFHVQDFSWGNQGYSLVKRHFDRFADRLDATFSCITTLTYKYFNEEVVVDTGPFRQGIWYYVHRILGIFHDDYNYKNVNLLIQQKMKKFIKKLACTPYAVKVTDIYNLGIKLLPSEKVHVVFLASESRRQAELIYGLHSIADWTSKH